MFFDITFGPGVSGLGRGMRAARATGGARGGTGVRPPVGRAEGQKSGVTHLAGRDAGAPGGGRQARRRGYPAVAGRTRAVRRLLGVVRLC